MPTHDPMDDAFGFGNFAPSAKEKIKHIRPSVPAEDPTDLAKIDALADGAGFVSREAAQTNDYVYRGVRSQRPELRIPLNMRVPISLGKAFQRFCVDNRYSYPEALAEVMRLAGLPTK